MRAIEHIRQKIEQDVFDYNQLMHVLSHYMKPRDVVSTLLQKGQIIRIRKGLYCFGELWRRNPVSLEMLANLIYGPSVISLDYALAWYGLIPEYVAIPTSVTIGRSRTFITPLGRFSYTHLSEKRYAYGVTLQKSDGITWIIAQPMKALADKVWTDKRFQPGSPASFADYLFKDLRIDENTIFNYFDESQVNDIVKHYSARKVSWMAEFLVKRMHN